MTTMARMGMVAALAIGTMLGAVTATAQTADQGTVQGSLTSFQLKGLPYEHVGDYTSNPGESEHAFLIRMVPIFRAFAERTGEEACAAIGVEPDGKTYGLIIGSNDSHVGCASDRIPGGTTYTGETIHTHGRRKQAFEPNKSDRIFLGMDSAYVGGHVLIIHGEDPDHFSETDFATGPGYLATPDGLLYQHGGGTEVIAQ